MWPAALILMVAVAGLLALLAWQRRRREAAEARARRWERLASDSAHAWRKLLAQPGDDGALLQHLAEQATLHLPADGALVWQTPHEAQAQPPPAAGQPGTPSAKPAPALRLARGAGVWRRPPAAEDVPPGPTAPDDFFWSRRPLARTLEQLRGWLPPHPSDRAPTSALLAPVSLASGDAFLLVTRAGRATPPLAGEEQDLLAALITHAELAIQVREAQAEQRRLQHALQTAHEDGMLQISRGIIHNLGNGLTAVQLAIENLRGGEEAASGELLALLRDEVLPTLLAAQEQRAKAGDEAQCLACLEAMRAGLEQLARGRQRQEAELRGIERKFHEITDIIALQQQFIGELGTENVVPMAGVLHDVGRLCAPALAQRGIHLELDTQAAGQVLADPAMLRHILTLLVKQAIEAVSAARLDQPRLRLALGRHLEDGRWLRVTVEDNAGGRELPGGGDQDAGGLARHERREEWQFCVERVAKYGDRLSRQVQLGQGTVVCLDLPEVAGRAAREPVTPPTPPTDAAPPPQP